MAHSSVAVLRTVLTLVAIATSGCSNGGRTSSAVLPASSQALKPTSSPVLVNPNALTFYGLGTKQTFQASESGYAGTLSAKTGNSHIATVSPASVANGSGTFTVTPIGAGSTIVSVRDAGGHSAGVAVTVTTLTLTLHDAPSAMHSIHVTAVSFAKGTTVNSLFNITPSSASCSTTSGKTTCTVVAGAPPGTDRVTVLFTAGSNGGGNVLINTQFNQIVIGNTNTIAGVSSVTFLSYYGITGSPQGSVTKGPPGDQHVWFIDAAQAAQRVDETTTAGVTTPYPENQGNTYVSIAAGSASLWFVSFNISPPKGYISSYIGSVKNGGPLVLHPTTRANCNGTPVYNIPASITNGPDGNAWFLEEICGISGVGVVSPTGAIVHDYRMPVDINGSSIYSVSAAQHQIVAGADGALWFYVYRCRLVGSACVSGIGRQIIGRITIGGAMQFFELPLDSGCTGGYVTIGGDHNIWFMEPCAGVLGSPSYVTATVGRITRQGSVTEYFNIVNGGDDIAEGADGDVYVAQQGGVARVVTSGICLGQINEYQTTLYQPQINSVGTGPDGYLYLSDSHGRLDRAAIP